MAATEDDPWQEYLRWNNAIAETLFPVGLNGQPAYLQLDSETIAEIAETLGEPYKNAYNLCTAVRCTLDLTENHRVLARHVRETRAWRRELSDEPDPPPCIGLLSVFVMAAEHMHAGGGVGANNYYDRLMEELGIPPILAASLRSHFAAQFRNHSLALWDALRVWLDAWDGRRGTPTATQVGGHKYVGVPISQALVRVQDRRNLRALFATRGYQPHDPPERTRLVRDLDRWMNQPGSPASNALRDLWNRGQSQAIADIVEQEIRSWSGQAQGEKSSRGPRARIRVALALRRRGLRTVPTLLLLAEAPESGGEKSNIPLAAPDTGGAGDEPWIPHDLHLQRLSLPGWHEIKPSEELLEGIGLLRQIDLEEPESGRRYHRTSQGVIVLKWDPEQDLYLEVDQVEIDERCAVLCESDRADQVRALLEAVTNGVASAWEGPQGDVPEDWQLFLEVVPVQADVPPEVDTADLGQLVPEPQYFFKVAGGIRLPAEKTWHLVMPPEIAAFSDDSQRRIEVYAVVRPLSPLDHSTRHLLTQDSGGAHVRLRDQADWLAEADLTVEFLASEEDEQSSLVRSTSVRLRSANFPRELSRSQLHPIAIPLQRPKDLGAVTGIDLREIDADASVVIGARVYAASGAALSGHPGGEGEFEVVPTTPEQASLNRAVSRIDAAPLGQYDKFLDVLSYARAGSWSQFQKLARLINDDWRFPYQATQALSSLGHIEVQLDPTSLRPVAWTVTPAALVVPPVTEDAFLAGFRSSVIQDALLTVVTELGGAVYAVDLQGAPSKISVKGLSHADLEFVAEYVSEETRVPLGLETRAPQTLIEKGSNLADMLRALPRRSLHDEMEVFRPGSGRWTEGYLFNRTGAVREQRAPRRYGIVLEEDYADGCFRVAAPPLARLFGLLAATPGRVSFDEERLKVMAPKLYSFPPLIERALVLCNGEPPRLEGSERAYRNVPESIGRQALAALILGT